MGISLKKQVFKDPKERIKKRHGSPQWINEAINFEHGLRIVKVDEQIILNLFQICKIPNRKENRLNMNILLANLVHHRGKKAIIVSMSPNDWTKSRYKTAGQSTIKIIDKFELNDFLHIKIGYRVEKESKKTRIWPTQKLLDLTEHHYFL